MDAKFSYTFEVNRWSRSDEWISSAGRWETLDGAANAAANWLKRWTKETSEQVSVRTCQVLEWPIENN